MGNKNAEIVFNKTKDIQRAKFEKLRQRETKSTDPKHQNKNWIINLSRHNLTEKENNVLQKGLNFAVPPKHVPRTEIVASVETAIRRTKQLDEETAERTRATIASAIRRAKQPQQNLDKGEKQAIASLRKNDDIIILPAHKGNATVILNTEDYGRKAADILQKPPFRKISRDPTAKVERQVNDTLKKMVNKGEIGKALEQQLRVPLEGTRTPLSTVL